MLAVSLALGLAFEWLFGERDNGLSVPVFMLAVVSALFFLLQLAGRRPRWTEYWLAAPLLFFAGMIAVRASPALKAVNTLAVLLLLILLVYVAIGKKISELKVSEYLLTIFAPLFFMKKFLAAFHEAEALHRRNGKNPVLIHVLKGLLLALPFLLVFVLLFSSADSVFGKYVGEWWESLTGKDVWFRILSAAGAAAFFIGMFHLAQRSSVASQVDTEDRLRKHAPVVAVTFLTLVNALFLVFVLVQIKYLYGGEAGLDALGLTYAEYARHGFFELLAVACLSFALLLVLAKTVLKKDGRHALSFKALGVLHVLLVLGIVLSAHKRLGLYEEAYGFTVSRFFAHGLVLWLGAVFLLLGLNIVIEKLEKRFALALFASLLVFAGAVNIMNPEAFIAGRNLERYWQTGKIDVFYLAELSADAAPLTAQIFDDRKRCPYTAYCAYVRFADRVLAEEQDWRSFNFAESKARTLLQAKGFTQMRLPAIKDPDESFPPIVD